MKKTNIYAADFETTVYKGQTNTEVWSSAICPIRTPQMLEHGDVSPADYSDVIIHHRIEETIEWAEKQNRDLIFYYHNLKFDGSFWIDFLLNNSCSLTKINKKGQNTAWTFDTLISDKGQWYSITICLQNGHILQLRDSLKLIPYSLRKAGKDFNTPHQKLEMEYTGKRYPGCRISEKERKYIANDVLVLAELIEVLYKNKIIDAKTLTIGSACMQNYRKTISGQYWNESFPRLDLFTLPAGDYGETTRRTIDKETNEIQIETLPVINADQYIRKSYKGGWCYAKDDRTGTVYNETNRMKYTKDGKSYIGITADVNSLYPSMMSSESGNRYPVGLPHFVKGSKILKYTLPKYYSFIRLRCRFTIKPNRLPFIQIKGSPYYEGTEMLKDSRPLLKNEKMKKFTLMNGEEITDCVELTLTCTDYELFHKHYNVTDEEILDGCYFYTDIGMFDDYINHWAEIKKTAPHGSAIRGISKLMLNNLYGKFSTSAINISKRPELTNGGVVGLAEEIDEDKKTVFIAIGSAITSYARRFTITAAQKNYNSFCYADTDSIHCLCSRDEIKGIKVHPVNFCCWKLESFWNRAIFVRQKTYIETVTHEDEKKIEKQYDNIKCAGMPQNCKDLLEESFNETTKQAQGYAAMCSIVSQQPGSSLKKDELVKKYKFLSKSRSLKDFKRGLVIPGKLMPRRIPGGVLLIETEYTMH